MWPWPSEGVAGPITQQELQIWRKQQRQLWLTFVGFPVLVSGALWGAFVLPLLNYRYVPSLSDVFTGLVNNLWGVQIVLSVWLSVVVTLRAASAIARERESSNWPLLKLTPFTTTEIFYGKTRGIWQGLAWPIRMVVALRIASLLFSYAAAQYPSFTDAVLAALFLYLFSAELFVSVSYNCAIGFLASTLAKTSAQAQGFAYGLHIGLFAFGFGPLWWVFFQNNYSFNSSTSSLLWTVNVHWLILSVAQATLASLCYSVAIHLAERFTE
jgi:hypothetical protein